MIPSCVKFIPSWSNSGQVGMKNNYSEKLMFQVMRDLETSALRKDMAFEALIKKARMFCLVTMALFSL